MKIVMVGAGGVATSLAHALLGAGHELLAIYSRTLTSARTLADALGGGPIPTDELTDLPAEADLFLICVKDDAVAMVGQTLSQTFPQVLAVHTAGSLPLDTLPQRRRGVLYPLQTFSRERVVDLTEVPLFLETSDPADMALLRTLAESLSRSVYEMSSSQRAYLHIAAVFCCNFANHLSTLSAGLLERHGIPFTVMLPLIDEMTRKLHYLPPCDAQTGPAIRHDHRVLEAQHALLLREGEQELADIYRLLSDSIGSLTLRGCSFQ